MRTLIVTSVASMIDQFNMNNIRILQELGCDVDVACNFESPGSITKEKCDSLKNKLSTLNVRYFQIDFSRSVFSFFKHLKSLNQLKKIISDNDYCMVHCHSPIGGMLTRIACKEKRKHGLKVIYTAHGFHFYKGAPLKNWLIFYPIEKKCSKWTDVLITINNEDYELARKKMKPKQVEYVQGVGVDVAKFSNAVVDVNKMKMELGIPLNAKIVLSVGELNKNKNHQIIIRALNLLKTSEIYYVIAGIGNEKSRLEELANNLNVKLKLLGFRKDVDELYKIANVYALPSLREGLNVSLMEAISSGCPVVASKIRGNVDLVKKDDGFLCNPKSSFEYANAIKASIEEDRKKSSSSAYGFSKDNVERKIKEIYLKLLN